MLLIPILTILAILGVGLIWRSIYISYPANANHLFAGTILLIIFLLGGLFSSLPEEKFAPPNRGISWIIEQKETA
jgi:hypothetical protein